MTAVCQQRVIGKNRSHSCNESIRGVAHAMHLSTRLLAGDPKGRTGARLRRRDATIERGGNLHGDKRKGGGDEFREAIVKPACRLLEHSGFDLDPSGTQPGDALTLNQRVGVNGGHDDSSHARAHECIRAGAGSTVVGARLKRYVGRRTSRPRAGLTESNNLSVVAQIVRMEAFTHQAIVPDEHAADGRIRRSKANGLLSLLQRPLHPLLVSLLMRHGGLSVAEHGIYERLTVKG
jgi:hypothetical protein